ncbi:hypothetical protein OQJ15_11745 [Fluoribacter dumoffii]|uniref:hypothetical protein n=1 Tax=Fluoribacter dumoffii TaxID=463 RepID=UPI002243AEBA|nr:hypothetical protein [Fluoribacter dumoffii]MCW8386980.1 hypothetical protein [Fluoribacter dumoffii]MCW8497182.1 hypothetical protein [Fluoribacter dumoffii]
MKTLAEILENLGLLYEKIQLPTIESSVEPNGGVLNLDKALADNPECWDTIAIGSSQLDKKTIIIKCNLKNSSENIYLQERIIKRLIEDNFSIYFPTRDGLKKLEDAAHITNLQEQYAELDPKQEADELKKLNLIYDRIAFFDKSGFEELCSKILNSPEAFFHFINFVVQDLDSLFSILGPSEIRNGILKSILEWSFDPHPNLDRDWDKKCQNLKTELLAAENQKKPIPPFLSATQPMVTADDPDHLYLSYLVQNYPELLKRLTHINLANNRFPLFTFLNQLESLASLSLENCEFGPSEYEAEPDEDVPLLTTSLRFFQAQDTEFYSERFAMLLNNSPQLRTLCLLEAGMKDDAPLQLNPHQLANLESVSFTNTRIAISQLNTLINSTSNLRELKLAPLLGPWDEPLQINEPLLHLKELLINSTLIFDDLYLLLNSAPNLETLTISFFDWIDSGPPEFQLGIQMDALKKLVLGIGKMSSTQLHSLLISAPNLTRLELASCTIDYDFNFIPNSLPNLKEIHVTNTALPPNQLLKLLAAAPNLAHIEISNPANLLRLLHSLQPGSLPFLNHIAFTTEALSFSEIAQLIKIAPNLKSISYPLPQNKSDKLAAQWLQYNCPQIELKLIENATSSEKQAVFTYGSLFLDGKIGKSDQIPNLPARTIFKAKEGIIPVSSYHLDTFIWVPESNCFKPYIPAEKNLEPVAESLKRTPQQIEEQFNHPDAPKELVYSQFLYEKPQVGTWLQLPALSATDKLINYAAEHPDYEIKRDKNSGYFFIQFKRKMDSCIVNYLLDPGKNIDFTLGKKPNQEHLEWLSRLSFDGTGKITDCEEYQQLLNLDVMQRIKALTEFCRFEKEAADEDIEGNVIDVLNALIQKRAGVCRHRAQLFSALADALQIDAHLVDNDVHQFILATHKDAHFTLDLGGGTANVVDLPMLSLQKRQHEKRKEAFLERTKKPVIPLNPGNRFQTWNSLPLQAKDADALAQKLSSKDSVSRQWLIFKDGRGIEALHQASLKCKNTFFSRDLDTLVLHHTRIKDNKDTRVDSPVSQFLKHAALNPGATYTWFIDWSDPKARHVSLNSVIDNEDRNLGGLPIPPNVHLVVGMDERSAFKMGDDYYSRFDAISQAPELPPLNLPEIKLNHPVGEDDVLFPSPLNWESVFLGKHTFDEGVLDIAPGALMKASQTKSTKLVLHNPPLEDPKFRFLIQDIRANKRFFFNGEWHELHQDFQLELVQPDLSTYPEIIAPKGLPGKKRIVNQTTLPLFTNQYQITKHHTIKPLPGFFAADSCLELVVTDNLTEIQWYSLLKEANRAKCALSIKITPKVFVPEPLKKWVSSIEPLGQGNCLVISDDLDAAEEHYKSADAITVNIDSKTNFNNLFFHVSLKNKQFSGEETPLLRAIKEGKPVVFKGQFSTTLAQQLQTLFVDPPTLWVNGEPVSAPNITLVTDNAASFKSVHKTIYTYNPENDFARLGSDLSARLKKIYQQLQLTPCHSHFLDVPKDPTQHLPWLDHLIHRLQWRAGILPHGGEPTPPEAVMDYLKQHPFVFLTSKTGAGKSYFVQKILPKYGKEQGQPLKIYHELAGVKKWLEHQEESQPVLFIDEANISQEHYSLFEALARGDKELWFEGICYPLKNHKIIFAGNPTHYEGRFEPDLFKRYPHYLPFEGQPLGNILRPLLAHYKDSENLLPLIETYYTKAQAAGLNITPRNAQMMCLRFFILKEHAQTKLMGDDFLMRYAILKEIKQINLDKKLSQNIRHEIKQVKNWNQEKQQLKEVLQQFHPVTTDKKFIWTESRKKIAVSIEMLLLIRDKKIKGLWNQEFGLNGIILEAEPGLGKSQLVLSLLKSKGVDYITITPTNPKEVQEKLLDAFHKGKVVFIEEFNTQIHEKLLNALLSGYDLEGNPPDKPGFCLIGTQNPTTFHGRQPLSKALDNRLMFVELSHYNVNEFIKILTEKFQLFAAKAKTLTEEYFSARAYAHSQSLFPPPNPRNVMKVAEEEQRRQELTVS